MRIDLSAYQNAFLNLPKSVAWAEINADQNEETVLSVSNGQQSDCKDFKQTVAYIRASDGLRTGTIYTEQLDEDPQQLIQQALENAQYLDEKKVPVASNAHLSISTIEDKTDVSMLLEKALQIEDAVKKSFQTASITECSLRRTAQARRVLNSCQLDSYFEHSYYLATLRLVLPDAAGYLGCISAKICASKLSEIDAASLVADLMQKAAQVRNLPKVELTSGKHDCILSTNVVRNILMTSWQAFVASRMATGKSVFSSVPGTLLGSPCLNIVDAPRYAGWGHYFAIDSEGIKCCEKSVVRQGRLVSPLHNLLSSQASGSTPTGNAGRAETLSGAVPVDIITIPSIFYIEPGDMTESELIAQMGDGVFLTYSLDEFHSIDIPSGEYSIPCGGVVYKNGKAVGTVDQIAIAGNLKDLFQKIEAAGDRVQLDEFEYKNYCFGGPSLLVRGLDFGSVG